MDDLATLLSQPVPLRVAVRDAEGNLTGEVLEHKLHPLTYNDIAALQAWVNAQFPDPLEQAWDAIDAAAKRGKPFNVTQQQYLLKNAQELALRPRHKVGMAEADALLMSTEGFREILIASIRKGNPDFGPEQAERLFAHMTQADIVRAYGATQLSLVLSDPKAPRPGETPSGTTNGPSTSRRTRRARAAQARKTGGGSSTS